MATLAKLIFTAVTSKQDKAGTDAHIYLIFDGGRMIWIPSEAAHFEKGQTDKIEWDVARYAIDYDKIQKVEIFNDSSGDGAGWYLDKVSVEGVTADGRNVVITRNEGFGWLDRTEKPGDRRELALAKQG